MEKTDHILTSIRKQVEMGGRSGADTVWMDNVSFRILSSRGQKHLYGCDLASAEIDFNWFLRCEDFEDFVPHPSPKESWWLKTFGEDAVPYGPTWNLDRLVATLNTPGRERHAILFNPGGSCIICYQFQNVDAGQLDVTVTMRSSDVCTCLAQDVIMSDKLLTLVADRVDLLPRYLTFNIGNAHVFYEDLEFQEEFEIDLPL